MKKTLIAAVLAAASMLPATLLAQDADPAVGRQVYSLHKVTEKEIVGTIVQADANVLRIQIGEYCVGLPRENLTEKDGQFESPWRKGTLEKTIQAGNPADFTCAGITDQSDPAVGKQVFATMEVQKKEEVGTVVAADQSALRIRIGDYCVGLPRENFTESDGQFQSPWSKGTLEGTIQAGNPDDFVCSA